MAVAVTLAWERHAASGRRRGRGGRGGGFWGALRREWRCIVSMWFIIAAVTTIYMLCACKSPRQGAAGPRPPLPPFHTGGEDWPHTRHENATENFPLVERVQELFDLYLNFVDAAGFVTQSRAQHGRLLAADRADGGSHAPLYNGTLFNTAETLARNLYRPIWEQQDEWVSSQVDLDRVRAMMNGSARDILEVFRREEERVLDPWQHQTPSLVSIGLKEVQRDYKNVMGALGRARDHESELAIAVNSMVRTEVYWSYAVAYTVGDTVWTAFHGGKEGGEAGLEGEGRDEEEEEDDARQWSNVGQRPPLAWKRGRASRDEHQHGQGQQDHPEEQGISSSSSSSSSSYPGAEFDWSIPPRLETPSADSSREEWDEWLANTTYHLFWAHDNEWCPSCADFFSPPPGDTSAPDHTMRVAMGAALKFQDTIGPVLDALVDFGVSSAVWYGSQRASEQRRWSRGGGVGDSGGEGGGRRMPSPPPPPPASSDGTKMWAWARAAQRLLSSSCQEQEQRQWELYQAEQREAERVRRLYDELRRVHLFAGGVSAAVDRAVLVLEAAMSLWESAGAEMAGLVENGLVQTSTRRQQQQQQQQQQTEGGEGQEGGDRQEMAAKVVTRTTYQMPNPLEVRRVFGKASKDLRDCWIRVDLEKKALMGEFPPPSPE